MENMKRSIGVCIVLAAGIATAHEGGRSAGGVVPLAHYCGRKIVLLDA
jgi:hypothetical protein